MATFSENNILSLNFFPFDRFQMVTLKFSETSSSKFLWPLKVRVIKTSMSVEA